MSSHFTPPAERRYADYKRRYSGEYSFNRHSPEPGVRARYATLYSARAHAVNALEQHSFAVVRIFDHKLGEYVMTYVRYGKTITPHKGFFK